MIFVIITAMKGIPATPVAFSRHKHGQPLAIDASSFPRWTGIVPDGEPHVLDFHEFLVVSEGTARVSLGDRQVRISGPTVLFTPPGVVRRVEVIDPLALELVVFSEDALRRSMWTSIFTRFGAGPFPVRDRTSLLSLTGVAQLMAAELLSPRPDSALLLDALLAQFAITLNRTCAGIAIATPTLLRRFEQLLEDGFRDHHAVKTYGASLGVSADHLSAVTRAHYGLSAKALVERRLFVEAVRLLGATTQSIAEIGAALGFDEPSQFSRAFKRACGQSPRRFRNCL